MSRNPYENLSLAIVGGKLQGIEAAYLAGEAGYHRILIDRRAETPASGLCEINHVLDVTKDRDRFAAAISGADIVLPALEDDEALSAVAEVCEAMGVPLAFDMGAYGITSSKIKTDALIRKLGIRAPSYDPSSGKCVVKPSGASGSTGVRIFDSRTAADAYMREAADKDDLIMQEYIEGTGISLEVTGSRETGYRTYEITEIHVDETNDCHMVSSPLLLPQDIAGAFRADALRLAGAIGLKGITDVEAIWDGSRYHILELDARLPSQTPAAVLASSGVNLLTELVGLFLAAESDMSAGDRRGECGSCRCSSYEDIIVDRKGARSEGEHIMADAEPLRYARCVFGADQSMTDYAEACSGFRGIFINSAATPVLLEEKRARMYDELSRIVI